MKRLIEEELKKWKNKSRRKPLLIRGARQVGKTYVVRQFAKGFSDFVEVNFELEKEARKIFEADLRPERIIRDLSLFIGKKIIPGKTLLFLDEIQEAPDAITSLRYFYERLPNLHVIAAGSLLEFEIDQIGLPVGRISVCYLYPLSFTEFLMARGKSEFFPMIQEGVAQFKINQVFHNQLSTLLGEYLTVGGMPESVRCWLETEDAEECILVLRELIETYRQDFGKYAKKFQVKYVEKLFNEVPRTLGKKFKFSHISKDYRKRELEPALDLLIKAGLFYKIHHTSANGFPLAAEAKYDRFKMIFLDFALFQVLLGVESTSWLLSPLDTAVNKGVMAEALIGQEVIAYSDPLFKAHLFYWHREAKSSNAEVDYIIEENKRIIPIEVKSGQSGTLKSLRLFLEEHPESPYGIRFYNGPFYQSTNIRSYPLYCLPMLNRNFKNMDQESYF